MNNNPFKRKLSVKHDNMKREVYYNILLTYGRIDNVPKEFIENAGHPNYFEIVIIHKYCITLLPHIYNEDWELFIKPSISDVDKYIKYDNYKNRINIKYKLLKYYKISNKAVLSFDYFRNVGELWSLNKWKIFKKKSLLIIKCKDNWSDYCIIPIYGGAIGLFFKYNGDWYLRKFNPNNISYTISTYITHAFKSTSENTELYELLKNLVFNYRTIHRISIKGDDINNVNKYDIDSYYDCINLSLLLKHSVNYPYKKYIRDYSCKIDNNLDKILKEYDYIEKIINENK